MQYLGDKLSAAQVQVSGWVGSVRRSLQGALDVVSGALQRGPQEVEEEETEEDEGGGGGGGGGSGGHGRFQRAVSPLRSLASRSRRSLRSLSLRGRQRLSSRKRTVNGDAEKLNNVVNESRGQDTDALIPDSEGHDDTQEPDNSHCVKSTQSPESVVTQHTPTEAEDEDEDDDEDEADTVDGDFASEPELPPFPEPTTTLLDSSVLRSRAALGKRRSTRTRPPKAVRHSAAMATVQEGPAPDWRFCDTADGKVSSSNQEESDSEDEQPREKEPCPPPVQPHRVALPGMDPASLKARLFGGKKRSGEGAKGGGGGGGGEEGDSQTNRLNQSPPIPAARSPRRPRVLPPVGAKESGGGPSPNWLKELKSKQRLSQHGQPDSDT
ncbi:182 kDa tankyrase-1-binding protein isoform X2 [Clupea harengus]|uniref:182 kDa tankyrase-1-binding protein isoform X2 n=1 Tax=Clupea harengus TaxID=7950 RepID=A0A6P8G2M2_CLUHA|nr:182 kDa tankyrase-1-binding protein isoform X2 [Clupea harengus]XP_031433384.1 182 kDa tankyrase-1-binding protein isoform X2 [Clupea harengus]